MKATLHGQGFIIAKAFILTNVLLIVILTGQNLKLRFLGKLSKTFFSHDNNNTNDNSDNNITLFRIPK